MDRSDTAIRFAAPADAAAIRNVNRAAFGGDEEAVLTDRLRAEGDAIAELVAESAGAVIGHILFSRLAVDASGEAPQAAALAPMAVHPAHQRRGVGATLIRHGLEACRARRIDAVVVLGHPGYYPRFGFTAAAASGLRAPFSGPAFMALELSPGALKGALGVRYAAAFGL